MSEENVELLRQATETFNRGHLEAGRRTGGMEKRRFREVLAFALVIAVALLASGCGGDDDGGVAETESDEATVKVTADPSGDLFVEKSLRAQAGSVTFEFTSPALPGTYHDFCVESPAGKPLGCTDDVVNDEPGEAGSATLTLDLGPGNYEFYCSLPGHRESGPMEGKLTVR